MRHNQQKRNDESNLLWATTIILSMAASCAAYTSYVVQSVLDSLKSTDAMVVLLTDSGVASDDKKLEANLNAAQRALETSADLSLALTIACVIVATGLVARVIKSMRFVILILMLPLVGCSIFNKPAPLPDATPAPKGIDLGKVGTQLDVIDSRVAAAVVVAREANTAGKPAVVESELSVASSFLPAPSEGDVAFARQRSEKATPAEYEAQRKKAAEKQKAAEKAWSDLEGQVEANKAALAARDKRIADLTAEIDRVKKDAAANLWTLAGVGVAVIGALATAFSSPKVGIPLVLCGAAIGAFPFVMDSPFMPWVIGGTAGCLCLLLLWFAFDWVRDRVKERTP